jgi:hypothetical protein
MDQLTDYRLDQSEKRAEAADARMARMEQQLTQIQISLAGLATKDGLRNWGMTVIAIVVATGIGVGALMMQAVGNQISAFQAGLAAIQTIVAAHEIPTPPQAPTNK